VDEPYKLWERFLIFLEQHRKGGGGGSPEHADAPVVQNDDGVLKTAS